MSSRALVAVAAAMVASAALAGCGDIDLTPTRGRIALLVTFAILLLAVMLSQVAARGDGKGDDKVGEGGGWVVLTFLSAVAALIIGTCNTFTAAPAREEAAASPHPAVPLPPPPSPTCEQALRAADQAFAALADANDVARSAAAAADRACRVEAPSPPAATIDAGP